MTCRMKVRYWSGRSGMVAQSENSRHCSAVRKRERTAARRSASCSLCPVNSQQCSRQGGTNSELLVSADSCFSTSSASWSGRPIIIEELAVASTDTMLRNNTMRTDVSEFCNHQNYACGNGCRRSFFSVHRRTFHVFSSLATLLVFVVSFACTSEIHVN